MRVPLRRVGLCVLAVSLSFAGGSAAGAVLPRVEAPRGAVGFGGSATVRLVWPPGAAAPRVSWRVVRGPKPWPALRVDASGMRVEVDAPRPEEALALPSRPGVVGVPARWAEAWVLEARWVGPDGLHRIEVRVRPAFATTGTRGVPLDVDAYVVGPPGGPWMWEVEGRTYDASIAAPARGLDRRVVAVHPLLEDEITVREQFSGFEVTLHAGQWGPVDDCARCHAAEYRTWQGTLHATVLERGLRGLLGPGYEEACLECHAEGYQPGAGNGGFDDVAMWVHWSFPRVGTPDAARLPPALAGLAGVNCLSCHGPGRFTPAAFDVAQCAACHDRPPRYATVAEWRRSPMSRPTRRKSDGQPVGRRRECAGCHTARGFVARLNGDAAPAIATRGEPEPVTCAACHDPHDARRPHQLRAWGRTGDPWRGPGALCVQCHRRAGDLALPPLATPLEGDVAATSRQAGASPHAGLEGGCVACHRPHRFAANRQCDAPACRACHAGGGACPDTLRREVDRVRVRGVRIALAPALRGGPCADLRAVEVVEHRFVAVLGDGRRLDLDRCGLDVRDARVQAYLQLVADRSRGAHHPAKTRVWLERLGL